MTSNPAAAVRMLIIYSICIPLAALVGWMLTNQLDYGTLGFFGVIAALLFSPLIIKWHYPILIFGLGAPIFCFFLQGNPPFWQVITILSLGISIIDRTLNSDKKFLTIPMMTWPLLFTLALTVMTAELTGGIGLHTLGGAMGGGKKYLAIFISIATYFALTSRGIPKDKRKLFVGLFFLSGIVSFLSDVGPSLPAPLNYINLLVPPSEAGAAGADENTSLGATRFGALASTAGVLINFMLVRFGLRGLFNISHPLRFLIFLVMLTMTMVGGFRIVLISYISICTMLFFLEGLHRTQMSLVLIFGLVIGSVLIVPFSDKLPSTFQRSLSFIPFLKLDPEVVLNAEGSKLWREAIWADTWPKVPQYLLLGKGYSLSAEDFTMMGNGTFANGVAAKLDQSQQALAISGDYHNGPLSTLMPFGIWGGIAFLWVSLTAIFIVFRNYRYGDAELKTVNAFMLVYLLQKFFGFFFLFGAYSSDMGEFAKIAGFSIALNWGVCGPFKQARVVQRINRMGESQVNPA